MTTETGQVQPTNKIVVDSTNCHHQTKKVETATNVYPGRMVIRGTNDDDVITGTSGGAVYGWVGYNDVNKNYRPATISTIHLINDQTDIINGSGVILLAWLLSGETVTKGARLVSADGGYVQALATQGGTALVTSLAEESVASTDTTTRILVRSLI
jgi:hypothetical protein